MPAGIPPRRLARTAVSSDTDSDGKCSTAANIAAESPEPAIDAIRQVWSLCPAENGRNWTALDSLSAHAHGSRERLSGAKQTVPAQVMRLSVAT